jgi:hypothetical protein
MKELTAQDLRIGNYANYQYFNPNPKNPDWAFETVEIVAIKEKGFLFKNLNKKSKYKVGVLYAIPLTEEWIERFGFKEDEVRDYMLHLDKAETMFLCAFSDDRNNVYLYKNYIMASDYVAKVEYVHQLQNLYHALTGEELKLKTQ